MMFEVGLGDLLVEIVRILASRTVVSALPQTMMSSGTLFIQCIAENEVRCLLEGIIKVLSFEGHGGEGGFLHSHKYAEDNSSLILFLKALTRSVLLLLLLNGPCSRLSAW